MSLFLPTPYFVESRLGLNAKTFQGALIEESFLCI
jgi:hypothetical protein